VFENLRKGRRDVEVEESLNDNNYLVDENMGSCTF